MEKFRQFYTENREKLFGYLLRKSGSVHLAADLAQESFTRYLERYRNHDLSAALLFTIARNSFYDHVRRQHPQVALEELPPDMADDQERLYIIREESRHVLDALQQLDEDDRDILSLVVSSGLTYGAIAVIKGCSEVNIKVRVHRARQKLRQLLPAEPL
jgi:RNA polymerase sigma-70 factor (ECF subfamily)